jgi:hypothetical protein
MTKILSASALLLLAGVLAAAAPTAPADSPHPATVVVEAKLLEKSSINRPEDIFVYKEGLVTYAYEVVRVVEGQLSAKTIRVTHYGVFRDITQPVTKAAVGSTATLRLRPLADCAFDNLNRTADIEDVSSPEFHDVGQARVYPSQGRWNYSVDVTRNMQSFHTLRNQLKLVVLGDCQGWFSNRTELHYGAENAKTPVALNLCQERTDLSFYRMMADDYLPHCPKLEWVVIAYHTRWVSNAKWDGMAAKTNEFKKSEGARFDKEHAADVFKVVAHEPITIAQIQAMSDLAPKWEKHPWGQLNNIKAGPKARQEAMGQKPNYTFNQQRWDAWEGIVKTLSERKIKVLAYTLPIHGATADRDVKDKNGTTKAGYDDQMARLKALEAKYPGFHFFDFNRGGAHGMPDSAFANIDHCSTEGATTCTQAVEAFRLQCK